MRALILVDIQNGLTKKRSLYNARLFFDTVNSAIENFRNLNSKIFFIQHNNATLKNGGYDWEIDQRIKKDDNDIIIQKNHGNAFQKTNLKLTLLDLRINSITIGGLVSHGCVKATCLGGKEEGFDTFLLKNGHTNWNRDAQNKIIITESELEKRGIPIQEL